MFKAINQTPPKSRLSRRKRLCYRVIYVVQRVLGLLLILISGCYKMSYTYKKQNNYRCVYTAISCGIMLLAGCSSGPSDAPELVEVTGKVLVDDAPAHAAKIQFLSTTRGLISTGSTAEDGTFRLIYKRGRWGAPIDKHIVTIETGEISETENGTSIPDKYADRENSGLTATVTQEGPNNFEFKLTSEE